VKVGIIGCGNIAKIKHLPSLTAIDGVHVIGFQDFVRANAQQMCDSYGSGKAVVYDTWQELLQNSEIGVVHICTPNSTHAQIAIAALNAGKHVMVEKPMAITSAEAKAMLEASQKNGKKLSVSHQQRFRPDVWELKKIIEKGELGEIYYAKALALRRRGVPTWGIFLNSELQGGGPLIDIGCHALDMTLWLMNNYKPLSVSGSIHYQLGKKPTAANKWGVWDVEKFKYEDSAFGFVKMENGATLTIDAAWALNIIEPEKGIVSLICGTEGGADMEDGLRINKEEQGKLVVRYPLRENPADEYKAYDLEAQCWIESLRKGTEPIVKPEQVKVVIQIIEALYFSAKTGKTVYFENDEPVIQ